MKIKLPTHFLTNLGVAAACAFGVAVLFFPKLWLAYNAITAIGIAGVLLIGAVVKVRSILRQRKEASR